MRLTTAAIDYRPDPLIRSFESCCCSTGIHYGYVVLVIATIGKVFTSPGQSPCIGVIIESVRLDVNISRSVMTGLYFAATTVSALILPLGGKWIDEFGPRVMVGVFACGLGFACLIMSRVAVVSENTGGEMKVFHCLHLFVSFFLLRFFGQGNLMNVSVTEINYWWIEKRGLVMGIAGSVVSATMLGIIPVIMMSLMTSVGWRQTYVMLGMASLFVMAPLGLLFFRGRPEQYGLLPDAKKSSMADSKVVLVEGFNDDIAMTNTNIIRGDDTAEMESGDKKIKDTGTFLLDNKEVNWTPQEIFRSRAFYVFAYSDLIIAAMGTAFWFHLRTVFQESGVSQRTISTIYPTLAAVSVLGRLFSGWLIDATSQRLVMTIGLFLQSMGLALIPFIFRGKMIAYIVAMLIGLSGSFCSNVRTTIYAESLKFNHSNSLFAFV